MTSSEWTCGCILGLGWPEEMNIDECMYDVTPIRHRQLSAAAALSSIPYTRAHSSTPLFTFVRIVAIATHRSAYMGER